MSAVEHIARLADRVLEVLEVLEVLGLVALALLARRTHKAVGSVADRVSAVGMDLGKVASSIRPPAPTCAGCAHELGRHGPRTQREGQRLAVEENAGACLAPFCCCPEWKPPVAFDDAELGALPEWEGP